MYQARSNYSRDIDLLLIGKTGNGKSATGNTILNRKVFKSTASSTSVTKKIQKNFSEYNGRVITIVDGPGVGDTDLGDEESVKFVIDAMTKAIAANTCGYHAFLLVVRFGGRFTKEDKKTIEILKAIFGPDFVKNYCILIVTCGDNFNPKENPAPSFKDWCNSQTGVFKSLFLECNGRVVLFDNITKNFARRSGQINELLSLVDGLSASGLRYTDENFIMAQKQRDDIILKSKIPVIQQETMKEASLIIQQLGKVDVDDPQNRLKELVVLKQRTDNLVKSVRDQDKDTGALKDIITSARNIQNTVKEHILTTKSAIEIKEKRRNHTAEIKKLRAEKERQKTKDDEASRQLDKKISEMDREDREWQERMEKMIDEMKKGASKVEAENVAVNNDSLWETIKPIGSFLLSNVMIPVIRFVLLKC